MQENTRVNLEIQPQVKGPLPEVRIKPTEKTSDEKLSELLVHLVLQKYNKLLAKIRDLQNKVTAQPFMQKVRQAKNTFLQLKQKYSDKEQNKARLAELKTKSIAQVKKLSVALDQKIKLSERAAPLQKYLRRAFWAGKIAELREEIQEIRLKLNNVLALAIKSRMDKKSSDGIIQS